LEWLIFAPGCSLSAGRAVSLLGASACGVSPVPLLPQESRTFRYNQPRQYLFKDYLKAIIFMKEPIHSKDKLQISLINTISI
jgi:hypothetical protein